VALSAAANVIGFGAIIWASSKGFADRRRLQLALGIPAAFNALVILFKANLTTDQRLAGALSTVAVCGITMLWQRRAMATTS